MYWRFLGEFGRLLASVWPIVTGLADWRKVEAWIKGDRARGTPELWAREQQVIAEHLRREPAARSFFVMDAETGREVQESPVLWIGGCQGVAVPPARTADGRLLVFDRSA